MTVLFGVREQHLLLSLAEHFHNQTLQSRTCYYMINMSATYKLKKVLKSGFVQLLLSYLSSNRCMLAWCHQKYYLIFFKMIPYLLQLFLIWKCNIELWNKVKIEKLQNDWGFIILKTLWKSEFNQILLTHFRKNLHVLGVIRKTVLLSLNWCQTWYVNLLHGSAEIWNLGWGQNLKVSKWPKFHLTSWEQMTQLRTNECVLHWFFLPTCVHFATFQFTLHAIFWTTALSLMG